MESPTPFISLAKSLFVAFKALERGDEKTAAERFREAEEKFHAQVKAVVEDTPEHRQRKLEQTVVARWGQSREKAEELFRCVVRTRTELEDVVRDVYPQVYKEYWGAMSYCTGLRLLTQGPVHLDPPQPPVTPVKLVLDLTRRFPSVVADLLRKEGS